jgi:hypothetical protein
MDSKHLSLVKGRRLSRPSDRPPAPSPPRKSSDALARGTGSSNPSSTNESISVVKCELYGSNLAPLVLCLPFEPGWKWFCVLPRAEFPSELPRGHATADQYTGRAAARDGTAALARRADPRDRGISPRASAAAPGRRHSSDDPDAGADRRRWRRDGRPAGPGGPVARSARPPGGDADSIIAAAQASNVLQ